MSTDAEIRHKRRRRFIQSGLGVLISGSLLALIVSQLDVAAALTRVQQADWFWVLASFASALGLLMARAIRFRILTQHTSLGIMSAAIAVQTFINRTAPFRLGELSLPYFLRRSAGESAVKTLISLALVRLLELWVLFIFAAVAIAAWLGATERTHALAVGLGAILLTLMLFSFRRWVGWATGLLKRLSVFFGLEKVVLLNTFLDRIEEAVADSERLTQRERVMLVLTSVLVFALTVATYDCLLRAVDIQLHPFQVIIGVTFAMVSGALPVTTVGSFGTHEIGWTAGFMWVGLSLNDALVTGLITQVMTLAFNVLMAIPGHFFLIARRIKQSD
jgi:uncharacterized membrane protein YbhN (UPF0104 family)